MKGAVEGKLRPIADTLGNDLGVALSIAVFLALRWRRALGALLLASIVSPLLDCIISLSTPGHNTAFALLVHGGATALVAVLGVVLFRTQEHSTVDESAAPSPTAASTSE